VFSLEFLDSRFDLDRCDTNDRAEFAMALVKFSRMTWQEIQNSHRHGMGHEKINIADTKLAGKLPGRFCDETDILAFRYRGKKPMLGFRVDQVFYVIGVEKNFGDIYHHG
jgi:hypothetical protein